MDYNQLRKTLDGELERILNSIPKKFSSSHFIAAVKDFFPDEYAYYLSGSKKKSNAFQRVNNWIARCYLNKKASEGYLKNTGKKDAETKTTVWEQKKK